MSKQVSFKNRDRFIQLGAAIATLRRVRGMSQEKSAGKAFISRSLVSAIEAPNMANGFSLEAFFHIADALEVDPADLISASVFPFLLFLPELQLFCIKKPPFVSRQKEVLIDFTDFFPYGSGNRAPWLRSAAERGKKDNPEYNRSRSPGRYRARCRSPRPRRAPPYPDGARAA